MFQSVMALFFCTILHHKMRQFCSTKRLWGTPLQRFLNSKSFRNMISRHKLRYCMKMRQKLKGYEGEYCSSQHVFMGWYICHLWMIPYKTFFTKQWDANRRVSDKLLPFYFCALTKSPPFQGKPGRARPSCKHKHHLRGLHKKNRIIWDNAMAWYGPSNDFPCIVFIFRWRIYNTSQNEIFPENYMRSTI